MDHIQLPCIIILSLVWGGNAGDMVVLAPAAHVSVVAHHVGDAAPLEV